jgi:hypothetical protein
MSDSTRFRKATRPVWVFATLGAMAVLGAVVVQFVVPGLDAEMLATMPGFVQAAYAATGKIALTIPLMVLGLGLISRDAIRNMHRGSEGAVAPPPAKSRAVVAQPVEEEVFAEEIYDELPPPPLPATTPTPSGKIRARFGRPTPADAPEASPTPFRNPNSEGGSVALSTAKYLNNGKPDFRKGGTRESFDS